jgi:hypothetical protein
MSAPFAFEGVNGVYLRFFRLIQLQLLLLLILHFPCSSIFASFCGLVPLNLRYLQIVVFKSAALGALRAIPSRSHKYRYEHGSTTCTSDGVNGVNLSAAPQSSASA